VNDLKRAAKYRNQPYPQPNWRFRLRPSLAEVLAAVERLRGLARKRAADLAGVAKAVPSEGKSGEEKNGEEKERAAKPADSIGPLEISFDLETRNGHIACAGLAHNYQEAICIPFMCVERLTGYWTEDEEAEIVYALWGLLTHPGVVVVGQYLHYDCQYTYRYWHFVPRRIEDTIIKQHVVFAGLPKKLDFQASMYCEHYVYWKDDSKEWNKHLGEEQLWAYNCEDCVRTLECSRVEDGIIKQFQLEEVNSFQQEMFWPVLEAMQRGVRIDKGVRSRMGMELLEEMTKREEYFLAVLGHPLNPRSPKQMASLFYDDLKQPLQRSRTSGNPTLDEEALDRLASREPLIRPLVKRIKEHRSLGVFLGTFIAAPLDIDERMRCSYNISGAYTYRLSSSKNAFGGGANLQTIPAGKRAKEPEDLELPNIRKMFVPDPGYDFFNLDLDRADLQVVVWEADDQDLKQALRLGVDMHCFNALEMFNIKGIPAEELVESHPNYHERRGQIGEDKRQKMKSWVHGTNYGGGPRTMAINCGLVIKEAEAMQA
ncbi:MAG: DNA polymerase, partial [Terriglobia bacterium]